MTALATLNRAAQVALDDCEQRIERGLKTFIEVGGALAAIRDNKLYRGTHGTFEAYCRERWGISDSRARQLVIAAETVTNVTVEGLPAPANEGQARALAAVPEADRADVWRDVVEGGDKPTAAAIRKAAESHTRSPGPSDAAITPPVDPGATPAPAVGSPAAFAAPQGPDPEPGGIAHRRELDEEMARESVRRTAVASIRSVLTYLTSQVLDPAAVARQYVVALTEFSAADLRFAAETMAALAALKEQ